MPKYFKVSILKDLPLKFVGSDTWVAYTGLPVASETAFNKKEQYTDTYPLKILEVIDF